MVNGFTTCRLCGWQVVDAQGQRGFYFDTEQHADHPPDSGRFWVHRPRKSLPIEHRRQWFPITNKGKPGLFWEVAADAWFLWPHEYTCSDARHWQERHAFYADFDATVAEKKASCTSPKGPMLCGVCHGGPCAVECPKVSKQIVWTTRALRVGQNTLFGKHLPNGYEGPIFCTGAVVIGKVTHSGEWTEIEVARTTPSLLNPRKVKWADVVKM